MVDAKKVGLDLAGRHPASREQHIKITDVPPDRADRTARPHRRRLGKYYLETSRRVRRDPVDVVKVLKDRQVDVLVCYQGRHPQ